MESASIGGDIITRLFSSTSSSAAESNESSINDAVHRKLFNSSSSSSVLSDVASLVLAIGCTTIVGRVP